MSTWVFVIYFYNTDLNLVKEFPTEKACIEFKKSHEKEFTKEKAVKKIVCEQGTLVNEKDGQIL